MSLVPLEQIYFFILLLLRVSSFFFIWPLFVGYSFPQAIKILTAVAVSLVLMPVSYDSAVNLDFNMIFILLAAKEVIIGLVLGIVSRFLFFAIGMGGNLISISMGLANAQIFNPAMGASTSPLENFYYLLALILFLTLNGHHYLLIGLGQSFEVLSVTSGINLAVLSSVDVIMGQIMELAVKVAAPIMGAIFILNLSMGIVGKTVPQINVLITSLPVNILAGFILMSIVIPVLFIELEGQIFKFVNHFVQFMKAMA